MRWWEGNAPDRIRTCDLRFRKPPLYPSELRAPRHCHNNRQAAPSPLPGVYGGVGGRVGESVWESFGGGCTLRAIMRLSLTEIRANAIAFSAEWRDATSERAEAQSFWNDFFKVFGIPRRSVASFEEKIRNARARYDRIDIFYAGVMLGEHKSAGEDLSKAASQAFDYVQSLTREGRADELPRFIIVSDFARIVLYDLDSDDAAAPIADFSTKKLHENIRHFGFLSGYATKPVDPEDPINIKAVEILGGLHDALEKGGYRGHELERFLVRILFCLFADDTGIFDPDTFKSLIQNTRADAGDLGPALARLFKVLDTPKENRSKALPDELAALPYVNGLLFKEDLNFADFNKPMRDALLKCCDFRWATISPAVFGSLFQSIMSTDEGKRKRRQIGAHYTSERDIFKLIRSLFLDDLHAELEAIAGIPVGRTSSPPVLSNSQKTRLQSLHTRLATLKFLDPACGCGNFLVVAYRELRLLELTILQLLHGRGDIQRVLDLDHLLRVNVDQMHGIEIEEWPARIAEVAMWLIDHQMNLRAAETFGVPFFRLPLTRSARIECANALRIDWGDVLQAKQCSFVMGNPPFVGKQHMSTQQNEDMESICGHIKGHSLLDYVSAWYVRAIRYIKATSVHAAFVSTNSICQGEQAATLWPALLQSGLHIHFAHRTFSWVSEARGKAHVHVVIIGFGLDDSASKFIVDYDEGDVHPTTTAARNISPYLVDGPDTVVLPRTRPLCNVPAIVFGSMPNDDGNLLLSDDDKKELLRQEPGAKGLIRPFAGADEFINGIPRWCLWIEDDDAPRIRSLPLVQARVAAVRKYRAASRREVTRTLADVPTQFAEVRQPRTRYLLIPRHSSERRRYIPLGYLPPSTIAGDSCLVVPSATPYHFGVLTSEMHMAWVRQVCGRLKSDFRYSNKLVYNNFPWPQSATDKQKSAVEAAAQGVLDAREPFLKNGDTLADLYDPLAMPKALRDGHRALDRAVDRCYGARPFESERARVEYLFGLYQELAAPLMKAPALRRPRRTGKRPA